MLMIGLCRGGRPRERNCPLRFRAEVGSILGLVIGGSVIKDQAIQNRVALSARTICRASGIVALVVVDSRITPLGRKRRT
jgi:hypothetical protein